MPRIVDTMSVSGGIKSFFGRALLIAGCLGVIASSILVMNLGGPSGNGSGEHLSSSSPRTVQVDPERTVDHSVEPPASPTTASSQPSHIEPSVVEPLESPNRRAEPVPSAPVGAAEVQDSDLIFLRARNLLIPV